MSLEYPGQLDDAVSVVRSVLHEIHEKNVAFMAGSIAYSAFVSLLPLLLLALLAAAVVGGDAFAGYVRGLAETYLSPAGQGVVADALTRAEERAGLSILGLVVLVWGAVRIFRGLDTAFSAIYGTHGTNDLLDQVVDGVVVLIAIGAAVLAMFVAGAVFALFPEVPFIGVGNLLGLIVGLTLALLPIYYVFPDVDVSVREVLPGAVVAAVGWTALQAVFQLYVALSSTAEVYGAIGAIILLITWLYFGAFVLLVGATTNAVLSGRAHPVPAIPAAA